MARIGGRSYGIAVPAGMLCAAVLGGLVWLALPMIPVTITWMGDTLRSATAPKPAATPVRSPAQEAASGGSIDCRSLYADDLWNELLWRAGSLLNQSVEPPATTAAFAEAAVTEVLVTCEWRFDSGGIVTTLSKIDADAAAVADAALSADGYTCTAAADALVCTRTAGPVHEEHTLRDGLWLASVETQWHPDDYGARLDRTVWG